MERWVRANGKLVAFGVIAAIALLPVAVLFSVGAWTARNSINAKYDIEAVIVLFYLVFVGCAAWIGETLDA